MKLTLSVVIMVTLGIVIVRVYTIIQRDSGFGCNPHWAFIGEEDLKELDERKLTGSPLDFSISENVNGTLKDLDIRHSTGFASLSSSMYISNNSEQLISTDLLMKLAHEGNEYQMEKVMLRGDYSVVDTTDTPLKLNLKAGSELYLTFFFNYEIFDPALKNQSLHQIVLIKTKDSNPKIIAQQQLTRVKRTFNCVFGIGHSLRPG